MFLFQFWERIKLYLMPPKHQPDFSFLRHVPLRRVHLFTLVQMVCLAVLWILKSTFLAIIFPVMVSGLCVFYQLRGLFNLPGFVERWTVSPPCADSGSDGREEAAGSDVLATRLGLAGRHPARQRQEEEGGWEEEEEGEEGCRAGERWGGEGNVDPQLL